MRGVNPGLGFGGSSLHASPQPSQFVAREIAASGLRGSGDLFVAAFDFVAHNIARFAETPEYGGGCIQFMATSPELEGKHGLFYSDYPPGKHTLVLREPSEEARDAREAAELWRLSEQLVGLSRSR